MSNAGPPLYGDTQAPLETSVRELPSRMALDEKAARAATFRTGGLATGGLLQRVPREEIQSFSVRMGAYLPTPKDALSDPPQEAQLGAFHGNVTPDR